MRPRRRRPSRPPTAGGSRTPADRRSPAGGYRHSTGSRPGLWPGRPASPSADRSTRTSPWKGIVHDGRDCLQENLSGGACRGICITRHDGPIPRWYRDFVRESLGGKKGFGGLPLLYVNEGTRGPRLDPVLCVETSTTAPVFIRAMRALYHLTAPLPPRRGRPSRTLHPRRTPQELRGGFTPSAKGSRRLTVTAGSRRPPRERALGALASTAPPGRWCEAERTSSPAPLRRLGD